MSIYEKIDPMPEHRTQFAFKGKKEHIAKVNISNMVYPNQNIDIKTMSREAMSLCQRP